MKPVVLSRSSSLRVYAFAPSDGARKVAKITIKQKIAFGQQLAIVGNTQALGNWDPVNSLYLKWNEGDEWTTDLDLSAGEKVEFKFVIADEEGVQWSEGDNIMLALPEDDNVSQVLVQANWEDPSATLVVKPLSNKEAVNTKPISKSSMPLPCLSDDTSAVVHTTSGVMPETAAAEQNGTVPSNDTHTEKEITPTVSGLTADVTKLESMTVAKLKALAVELGVSTSGKKADLIKKLKDAMQN